MTALLACPCGRTDDKKRPVSYDECCGRYVDHVNAAPDAEHLMRSRYSAFVNKRSRFVREDGRWFYVDGDQRG